MLFIVTIIAMLQLITTDEEIDNNETENDSEHETENEDDPDIPCEYYLQ